jgi:hypothetical protein
MSTSAKKSKFAFTLVLLFFAGCMGAPEPALPTSDIETQSAECNCSVFFDVMPCASSELCVRLPLTASEDSVDLVSNGPVLAASVVAEWEPSSALANTFHVKLLTRTEETATLLAEQTGNSPVFLNATGLDLASGTRFVATMNAIERETGGTVDVEQEVRLNLTLTLRSH